MRGSRRFLGVPINHARIRSSTGETLGSGRPGSKLVAASSPAGRLLQSRDRRSTLARRTKMSKPTHADAELLLHLYDIRREPAAQHGRKERLRAARRRQQAEALVSSSFGRLYVVTTFGESHGPAVGVVVDGMPPGISVTTEIVQRELDRRRPGQSSITTQRQEADQVEILSGVFDGMSLGTPIAMLVRNTDARSKDYDALKDVFRPGHADYSYVQKYGI